MLSTELIDTEPTDTHVHVVFPSIDDCPYQTMKEDSKLCGRLVEETEEEIAFIPRLKLLPDPVEGVMVVRKDEIAGWRLLRGTSW